ncbi:cytidylyltransferase domain-containing protein [candidate division KSB1 bacterium]
MKKEGRSVIAVIPARGGSKGIPKKNIVPVAGKPLIAYTIETAKKSKLIQRIIVSTDSKEIADIAKKYGAEVPFMRPKEFAKDDTPDLPVFRHSIGWLEKNGEKPDIIVNLRPTTPLRTSEDIDNAVEIVIKEDCDSVRSFFKADRHPYWMYKIEGEKNGGKAKPFTGKDPIKHYPRRQLLPPLYNLNACVDVMTAKNIKKGSLYGKDMRAYIMPAERSLDIDDKKDLKMFEMMLRLKI